MTPLAPILEKFFREYLPRDRGCSPHTCDAYAHAFRLLVCFAAQRHGTTPSGLALEHLDTATVLSFLADLEQGRGNSPSTRNARLAAIKSFVRFVEYRVPSAINQVRQLLAIPAKKKDLSLISHLNRAELQSLLDAPDPNTLQGLRDRAMLHLCFAAGLRVSELIGVRMDEVLSDPRPAVRIRGKGRKERVLPLWCETHDALLAWLAVRPDSTAPEVFVSARRCRLSRSGFEYILAKHVDRAASSSPSLRDKRVSPHVLRHTCAMHTLQATRDVRKVSLWLGHASVKSTEVYLRADPTEKLAALQAGTPPGLRSGQFQAPDQLLAMLRRP